MKKFLRNIAIIILSIFLVVFALEFIFKNHYNFIEQKFNNFYNMQDSIEVIFIGNSHMQSLSNFEVNNHKSYNFSVGGQDIFHIYAIVKTITQTTSNIKFVVMGIDYDLLGYDYKIGNMMWQDRLYYRNTQMLYDSSFTSVLMAKSNFFLANRNFKNIIKNNNIHKTKVNNIEMPFIDLKSPCDKRALEHSYCKYNKSLINKNLDLLQKTNDLLDAKNIELILINLPKKQCYYEYYVEDVSITGKELLGKFSIENNVAFIDLWEDKTFNDNDFIDNDHLNPAGAEKVIQMLSKYFESY